VYVFGEGRQGNNNYQMNESSTSNTYILFKGQLGHGQYDTQTTPMLVETPSIEGRRKAIRQIGCGAVSSWVLLGKVYVD
jgi:hypothetical protein